MPLRPKKQPPKTEVATVCVDASTVWGQLTKSTDMMRWRDVRRKKHARATILVQYNVCLTHETNLKRPKPTRHVNRGAEPTGEMIPRF